MPAIDSVDFLQNAPAPGYSARDLRRPFTDSVGEGVYGASDYRVTFNAGLNVTVAGGTAYVRGNSNSDQGMYRCNLGTSKTVTLAAADASNPRIDQIVLQVRDAAEDAGAANDGQVTVITGTPTAGATLDNRSGAASLAVTQPSLIVLADVLVNANNSPALSATNIRDRRAFGLEGVVPSAVGANKDQVGFVNPWIAPSSVYWTGAAYASHQSALLMYLPRRIAATHVRWRYTQDSGTQVGTGQNWNIAVCDASGRLIAQTGATAFAGAVSTSQKPVVPFSPALPAGYVFERGWYYVWVGLSAITSTSQCWFRGYTFDSQTFTQGNQVPFQNMAFKLNSGGTTFDASGTLLNMNDPYGDAGLTLAAPIPQVALSIA